MARLSVHFRSLFLCACWLFAGSAGLRGQVPAIEGKNTIDHLTRAGRWIDASAFHAARQTLEKALTRLPESAGRADELALLATCAFEDQQYGDAFRWSEEFVHRYPHDIRTPDLHFIRGVSSFQNGRSDESEVSLDVYLARGEDPVRKAEARFWRAMCRLEAGEWSGVEADLADAYEHSGDAAQRDLALVGLALSLERRGSSRDAAGKFEQYLVEFPDGRFSTQARLRLAALSLRLNNVRRAQEVLSGLSSVTRREREEYLLLSAEAELQSGSHSRAAQLCEKILIEFPDHPQQRRVQYNLAWSYLKGGDSRSARQMFDSLSRGSDSIAFASLYQMGVISLLGGKSKEAVAAFDSLVNRSPYDPLADRSYFQMGMAVYRNRQYRDARKYFQFASRMFPDSPVRPEAFRMLGEANIALSDFSNAQYAFSQVRKLSSDSAIVAPSLFKEGVCLYHLGRFRTAIDRLGEYMRKYPQGTNVAEAQVWKGEALYQDGQYENAERAYGDALRLFPGNPLTAEAAYGIAWSQFEQKRFRQAAASFERFASQNPQSEFALEASLRTADCYFFMGEYERAASIYTTLTSAAGGGTKAEYAAFQIAMSYIQRGESARGIEKLHDFLSRYPGSVYSEVAQFNIGWTHFSGENYPEAIAEFRAVLSGYPQSQLLPRVLFNLGDAFYNEKSYDSARTYYEMVIRQFPASPLVQDALNGLQYTYEAEGKPAEALRVIEQFMAADQSGASREGLLMKKGDILFGQGDFAGAIQHYEQVLSLRPDSALEVRVLQQLARSYELENNTGKAVLYYERILSTHPGAEITPSVGLALGTLHIKNKQHGKAASVFAAWEKSYPASPLLAEVQYHHGVALLNGGNKREAAGKFSAVIQSAPAEMFADRSRIQMARLHQGRKEYAAALDTLEGIVGRRSDDLAAEALLSIGENYLLQKKTASALQAFKDVIDQYSEYAVLVERARLGAGECHERLNDRASARKEYEEVVRTALDPGMKKNAEDRLKRLRR